MLQLVEVGHLLDGFLQFFHQVGDIIFGDGEVLSRADVLAAHFVGCAGRIAEISGDGFSHGLAGVEQPEHDKERHHGGDEICIGNLPGAAVVSTMTRFLLDNDDWAGAVLHTDSQASAASRPWAARNSSICSTRTYRMPNGSWNSEKKATFSRKCDWMSS